MALWKPEYQDHNFDISLTTAEGFLLALTHKTLKGRLYHLDNQAVAISACVLGYMVSYKRETLLLIWVTSMVEHLDITLHQPLCTTHKESQLILSS